MKYIFIFPLKVKSHFPESRSPLASTHRDIQDIYKLSTKCCVSLPFSSVFYVFFMCRILFKEGNIHVLVTRKKNHRIV